MAYPWTAHDILTAADLNAAISRSIPKVYVKTADESVTSSTTIQNDDELASMPLTAGISYAVEAFIIASGAAAGDIKITWARSGTINQIGARLCIGPTVNTTDVQGTGAAATTNGVTRASGGHALTTAISYGTDGTNNSAIHEQFTLQCVVSGQLTFQWTQNASSGTATIVKAGSWIKITPIQ